MTDQSLCLPVFTLANYQILIQHLFFYGFKLYPGQLQVPVFVAVSKQSVDYLKGTTRL